MCVCVREKVVNDQGEVCPNDGKTCGHLMVRGPAIAGAYFKGERRILDHEGYFDTGDVSTLSSEGVMSITDRDKDVIKSGGEWISSIEIENEAVGHPEVRQQRVCIGGTPLRLRCVCVGCSLGFPVQVKAASVVGSKITTALRFVVPHELIGQRLFPYTLRDSRARWQRNSKSSTALRQSTGRWRGRCQLHMKYTLLPLSARADGRREDA